MPKALVAGTGAARTIADLDGEVRVRRAHVAEALSYSVEKNAPKASARDVPDGGVCSSRFELRRGGMKREDWQRLWPGSSGRLGIGKYPPAKPGALG
jgi:hypothetical protein